MNKIFAAFDLGGSFLKYGMGTSVSGIQYDSKIAVKSSEIEYLYSLFTLAFDDMKKHLSKEQYIAGACIGSPGTANAKTGRIEGINPNLPSWTGANPVKMLHPIWGIPVYIDNDANLMAYGEYTAYKNQDSLLGITIGTGIGSGFVTKRGIFHGSTYAALEVGHTIVVKNGLLCNCGKKGCAEAYGSANSIVKNVIRKFPALADSTIKDILIAAKQNPDIKSELDRLLDYLAQAIANAVTILNPAILVIGGGVVDIPAFPFSYLKERVLSSLLPDHKKKLFVEKARFGNKAALLGGIYLAEKKSRS
ncbi:MAG TPA: ROK family protein [Candidatus Cloacimonadota bacterium]|nr:ROK family protein [Candidatus Cloacimonadota bacterium]